MDPFNQLNYDEERKEQQRLGRRFLARSSGASTGISSARVAEDSVKPFNGSQNGNIKRLEARVNALQTLYNNSRRRANSSKLQPGELKKIEERINAWGARAGRNPNDVMIFKELEAAKAELATAKGVDAERQAVGSGASAAPSGAGSRKSRKRKDRKSRKSRKSKNS